MRSDGAQLADSICCSVFQGVALTLHICFQLARIHQRLSAEVVTLRMLRNHAAATRADGTRSGSGDAWNFAPLLSKRQLMSHGSAR